MRMDKLTHQLQQVLADAQSLAVGRDHQFIEPVHVLSAMVLQQGGSVRPLLQQCKVDLAQLGTAVTDAIDSLPTVNGSTGDVHISQETSRLLNRADKQAQDRKDSYLSSELVLLAMLDKSSPVASLLASAGVEITALSAAIDAVRG